MDVLFIEDNAVDVRLAEEAFGSSPHPVTLHVVSDGVEAMAFLRKEAAYWSAPRPHLILLDLSVRKMNGRQVLAEIKNDGALSAIPVIVLTVSDNPKDVQYCCETRVNSYAIKPGDMDAFNHLAEIVDTFLSTLANFPDVAGKYRRLMFEGPKAS
jgi:two-component system, chemotaxis family, response regulator Rcp1